MATYLTKNFTLEELTRSNTASALGINNTPDATSQAHLKELANVLQSIRDYYGKGIVVNCAYRCKAVNTKVGGASTSQHMTGYAADLKAADGNNTDLKLAILAWAKTHVYDQIILEQCDSNGVPAWIHFGYKHTSKGQRRQQLKAKKVNGKWNYTSL